MLQLRDPSKDGEKADMYCAQLYKLLFFAENICLNGLLNRVMDAIQDAQRISERMPCGADIAVIYNCTHEKSNLRLYAALTHVGWSARSLPETDLSGRENTEKIITPEILTLTSTCPEFAFDFFACHLPRL
jgi:hypothetical protein